MISSVTKTSTAAAMLDDSDLGKRLEIKAEASNLSVGATTNDIRCPWCKQNKSFAVTKTAKGDILFMCHRSRCGQAGYIRYRGWASGAPDQGRMFTPRVFDYPTTRVGGTKLSYLVATYDLTPAEVHWAEWMYSYKNDRLVMPVFSPFGAHRGHVAKAYNPNDIPKDINYKEVDDTWMAWYIRDPMALPDEEGKLSTVVVVEDMVSALKASRFYPAVAILGSHINYDMLTEIVATSDNVVISLDRDATQKAYEYSRQFALFGNFRTVPLSKDVKNMNKEELEEWSERL